MINNEIIKVFYAQKLYLQEKTPINRLQVWYTWRQPIDLIETILNALNGNSEAQKTYLKQITDINEIEDADRFIEIITSGAYIDLLQDETVFYYLWHKMWNIKQKTRFTKIVNQKLGTKYHAGDVRDPSPRIIKINNNTTRRKR